MEAATHPTSTAGASTPPVDGPTAQPTPGPAGRGRDALVVPAVMGLVSTLLVIGLVRMPVPADADFPGPRFYPTLLAVVGYLLTVLLVVHFLRNPDAADRGEHRTYSDWTAFAWVAGGFAAFATLLDLLGWVVAAALLFWCVTRAFRGERPAFDLSVGLVVSSTTYLIFGAGLGLPLPSGILGGL